MQSTISVLSGGLLTLALAIPGEAQAEAIVKLSNSGICHDSTSAFYGRTQHFQPFDSLSSCLNAGGRLPKGGRAVATATVQQKDQAGSRYKREYFGHGWDDADGNCRNTRHELLAEQSTAPVRYKTSRQCRVVAGRWISMFTGDVIHNPRKMDIDHIVPLYWSWQYGADRWGSEKRERFANDPANLVSVEASLNRQKGASGPDEWLPPANQCQYVLRFLRVAKSYQLNVPSHYQQLREVVCNQQR